MVRFSASSPIETTKKTKGHTEGERRFLTMVFADLSGFTAISKSLEPEDVRDVANLCFEHLNDAIVRHGGTIHKYEGDLVIALFGVPDAREDDPERAIKASLAMMACMPEINKALSGKLKTKRGLGLHIGISSGTVFVGEIGSQEKKEYTVMGEIVNLASRLKDRAQNGEILVSEPVFRLSRHLFDYENLPPTELKGIEGSIKVFKILALKEKPEPKRGIRGLSSPLVGRDREFTLLKEKLGMLQQGNGGAVFIMGDAGLGKSRLLEELKKYVNAQPRDESAAVPIFLEGRCHSTGEALAYYPFLQILKYVFCITERDPVQEIQDKLVKFTCALFPEEYKDIVPYLGYLFSIHFPGELDEKVKYLDPKSLKIQLFISIRKLMTFLANRSAIVLIIEDYHWIDPESLELLEYIFDVSETVPLLFLGLSRIDKETHCYQTKDRLKKKLGSRFLEITLRPLEYDATSQLTDNLLQISGITQEFKDKILAKTEGNPFFLEEIIRSLIDANVLAFESGVWHVSNEISALEIPDTVQLLVSSRLDRLEPETRDLLQRASVIGRTFDVLLLERLAGLDSLMLSLQLATLEEYEFISRNGESGARHKFRHPLLHEVTYNSLLKKRRRELHRNVAQSIEEIYPDQLDKYTEVLAHQYANSDNVEKAIEWLKKAGLKAKERYANDEGIMYFQQLISFIKDETEGREADLCAAYDGLGDIYSFKGEIKKAIEFYTMMCLASKDSVAQARSKRKIAMADEDKRGVDEALKMLDEAEKLISSDTPESMLERTEIRLWRCSLYRNKGEADKALAECEAEVNGIDRLNFADKDKKRLKARGLTSMGLSCWVKGDYEQAVEFYTKSLAIYQELGFKRGLSINLNNLGLVYMDRGEYDQAFKLFEEDLKIAEEIGHKRGISISYNNMADIYYYRGEYEKALDLYAKDLKIVEEIGDKSGIGVANGYMGVVYRELGDWSRAQATTLKFLEMASLGGDKFQLGTAHYLLAEVYLAMGEPDKAEGLLQQALDIAKKTGNKEVMMKTYLSLAEFQMKKGAKIESVWDVAEKAWELAETLGSKSGLANCHLMLGRVFAKAGAIQKADDNFLKAFKLYEDMGRRKSLADTLFERARMLKNLGKDTALFPDPEQMMASCLIRAREIYQALKLDHKVKELEEFHG